jgi:hypothetical protein
MEREELLRRDDEAWMALVEAAEAVPSDRRDADGVVPGWSTHDVLWHCVFWADFAGASLELRNAGRPDAEPPEPPEPEILAMGRSMSWDEVMEAATRARERARSALAASSEINQAVAELFAGETFDHYDEHAAEIRAFIA